MIRVRPPTPARLYDLARLGLEEVLRESLPPEDPEVARFFSGLGWRWLRWLKRARARLLLDEVRRTFRVSQRTAEGVVREAHDIALQAALEGLLLARIPASELPRYVRIEGEPTPGSILLVPSLSGVPVFLAALARRRPGLVVFRHRGPPPEGLIEVGPLRSSALNRLRVERRLAEEDRLPWRFTDDEAALPGLLAGGAVVAMAADGRAFRRYAPARLFGRDALLGEAPWTLGVPIAPAFVHRNRDKSWRAEIGAPQRLDRERWIREIAEPRLEERPGDWAMWLAECRMLAGVDDHPLFLDVEPLRGGQRGPSRGTPLDALAQEAT